LRLLGFWRDPNADDRCCHRNLLAVKERTLLQVSP
jgi:hypothetical protein